MLLYFFSLTKKWWWRWINPDGIWTHNPQLIRLLLWPDWATGSWHEEWHGKRRKEYLMMMMCVCVSFFTCSLRRGTCFHVLGHEKSVSQMNRHDNRKVRTTQGIEAASRNIKEKDTERRRRRGWVLVFEGSPPPLYLLLNESKRTSVLGVFFESFS